jgi:hypothetical protein
LVSAGVQAARGSHLGAINIHRPGQSTTLRRVVGVAATRLVTSNGLDGSGKVGDDTTKVSGLEGRILPDRESVVTATCLSLITSALVVALAVIKLGTADG